MFIHDRYIFASLTQVKASQSMIQEFYSSPKDSRGKVFRKKIGLEDIPFDDASFKRFLDAVKIPNVYEYALRGLDRDLLVDLVKKGLIWFIPFKNIIKVSRGKSGVMDIIDIIYQCPFTGVTRVFRTVYDADLMERIKQLCKFNETSC